MLPERRSTFVLNTTISELILLLFFLLLLLLVYAYIRSNELETSRDVEKGRAEKAEQSVADLRARVDRLQAFYDKAVSRLPEAKRSSVADTLVAIDKLRASISNLDKKKLDLEKEILAHEELIARLSKKMPPTEVTQELRKEIGDLALCKRAKDQMPAMQAHAEELEFDNKNLRNIAREATAKAAKCTGRGEEFVACWRDPETKKLQYIYEVRLENNMLRVERRWPESRDPEMSRFPAEREITGRIVSIDEFMRVTDAIFAQSVRDSCRHYVVISGDRSRMNPNMFQQFIRIQDHFYKQSNIK